MTAHNDLDRQLNDFLRDGPTELPYESFDAVRDRTEQTGQRVVIGPWRTPHMNAFAKLAIAAAAVVAVAVIGINLMPDQVGPGATPSVSPSPTPTPINLSSVSGPLGQPSTSRRPEGR